jgi:hypothetical protein
MANTPHKKPAMLALPRNHRITYGHHRIGKVRSNRRRLHLTPLLPFTPHCQRLRRWQIFLILLPTVNGCAVGRYSLLRFPTLSAVALLGESKPTILRITWVSNTLSSCAAGRNGPSHHFGPQRSQKSHHPAIFIMASSNVSLLCYS